MSQAVDEAHEIRNRLAGDALLDNVEVLLMKNAEVLTQAEKSGDHWTTLAAVREARPTLETPARLRLRVRPGSRNGNFARDCESDVSPYWRFIVELDLGGLPARRHRDRCPRAIDDVAVTQASAVWELREADPDLTAPKLFRAGMRVGRDHVGSIVNTLALAYAGASLPLLILFQLSEQPLGQLVGSEVVATEVVRTLVGSIGLVASMPVTTWLAAHVATGQRATSAKSLSTDARADRQIAVPNR